MKRVVLLLAVFGVAAFSATASAQPSAGRPSEEITVIAPYLMQKRELKANIRTPVLIVSVQRHVSYADLDLSKAEDANKLESRVNDAANAACKQLDKLYSPQAYVPLSNVKDCAKSAADHAMTIVREICNLQVQRAALATGDFREKGTRQASSDFRTGAFKPSRMGSRPPANSTN